MPDAAILSKTLIVGSLMPSGLTTKPFKMPVSDRTVPLSVRLKLT